MVEKPQSTRYPYRERTGQEEEFHFVWVTPSPGAQLSAQRAFLVPQLHQWGQVGAREDPAEEPRFLVAASRAQRCDVGGGGGVGRAAA